VTVVYMARHGRTQWNASRRLQGQVADVPLDEVGLVQADELAARLAGRGVGALYCSDQLRARQTAAAVAQCVGIEAWVDVRLRERSYGQWEGGPVQPIEELGAPRWTLPDWAPPGGETMREVWQRVASFFDELRADPPADVIGIVSHGDTIRIATSLLIGRTVDDVYWWPMANGTLVAIDLDATGGSLRDDSDVVTAVDDWSVGGP
jgi:broad specificity phosphatase PhoE